MSKPEEAEVSPLQKEMRKIRLESLNRYREKYYPQERAFVKEVRGSQGEVAQDAQNRAAVGVEQAFADMPAKLDASLARQGVDPSSGRGIMSQGALAASKGAARADAATQAETGAQSGYFQNLASLLAKGKGQESQALRTGQQIAENATNKSIMNARADAASRAALKGLVSTAAGYGAGALGGMGGATPNHSSLVSQANQGAFVDAGISNPTMSSPDLSGASSLIPSF